MVVVDVDVVVAIAVVEGAAATDVADPSSDCPLLAQAETAAASPMIHAPILGKADERRRAEVWRMSVKTMTWCSDRCAERCNTKEE